MTKGKHTPGPWWIWKERAGCDEDELLCRDCGAGLELPQIGGGE